MTLADLVLKAQIHAVSADGQSKLQSRSKES